MATKRPPTGENIGNVQLKLGRNASPDSVGTKASSYVNLNDLDVETGEQYVFEIRNGNAVQVLDSPVRFVKNTSSTEKSVFIPTDVIRSNDLLPGHSISVQVYETVDTDEQQYITDVSDTTDTSEQQKLDEIHKMLTDLHEAAFGTND